MDPANGGRQVWSREEDEIILLSVAQIGPRWIEIANRLPGRTDHAARNRYHRLQRFNQPGGEQMVMLPYHAVQPGALGAQPGALTAPVDYQSFA